MSAPIKASEEFATMVRAYWRTNQGALIPVTINELEKHAERLGLFTDKENEENGYDLDEADRIGTRIFDLMIGCDTPEEYIAAIEREFLNPTFN